MREFSQTCYMSEEFQTKAALSCSFVQLNLVFIATVGWFIQDINKPDQDAPTQIVTWLNLRSWWLTDTHPFKESREVNRLPPSRPSGQAQRRMLSCWGSISAGRQIIYKICVLNCYNGQRVQPNRAESRCSCCYVVINEEPPQESFWPWTWPGSAT